MNTDLITFRTFDVSLVLTILNNEIILDAISEDGFDVNSFKIDVMKDHWIALIDGDKEIGVAQFKPMFNKCFDCHIHILPNYRKEYSEDAGKKLLQWADENLEDSLLYTNVPVFCKSVKAFLLNFGFKEVGLLEKAWLKNGIQHDMWILTKRVD